MTILFCVLYRAITVHSQRYTSLVNRADFVSDPFLKKIILYRKELYYYFVVLLFFFFFCFFLLSTKSYN